MATQAHLDILRQGVESWNTWRKANPGVKPDLRGIELIAGDLSGANLSEVDFSGANLRGTVLAKAVLHRATLVTTLLGGTSFREADLEGADLEGADLEGADLEGACLRKVSLYKANLTKANLNQANLNRADLARATLSEANLSRADIRRAKLHGANLCGANLRGSDLSGSDFRKTNLSQSDLRGADLRRAQLVETNLEQANLTGCLVYGIAAWNTRLDEKTEQQSLIITPKDEPTIVVDDLEVAQFIYLLLNNEKIRRVIDTVTARAVLILGRFTYERKAVLNAIRENLRSRGYVPILFDFDKPDSRDLTETITTLARMSRFIIADLTEPHSIPHELVAIIPDLPSIPVQPLLQISARAYPMFEHLKRYPWVLETLRYESQAALIAALPTKVIAPAEAKLLEVAPR